MTKEGSTKIVNFNTPMAEVLMLGRGHISNFSEYVLSSILSIYSTLIAIVLRDYDAAFRYHSWFSFILWWAVDIEIWALLTRSQCKVSDTQVTVKACGPLVLRIDSNIYYYFYQRYMNRQRTWHIDDTKLNRIFFRLTYK